MTTPPDNNRVRTSIENWRNAAFPAIQQSGSLAELEAARVEYFARHSPYRETILRDFAALPKDAKRELGGYLNEVLHDLETEHEKKRSALARHATALAPKEDLTLPARRAWQGAKHPVTLVIGGGSAIILSRCRRFAFSIDVG